MWTRSVVPPLDQALLSPVDVPLNERAVVDRENRADVGALHMNVRRWMLVRIDVNLDSFHAGD